MSEFETGYFVGFVSFGTISASLIMTIWFFCAVAAAAAAAGSGAIKMCNELYMHMYMRQQQKRIVWWIKKEEEEEAEEEDEYTKTG